MITLLQLCSLLKIKVQLSTASMETSVFESSEAPFFAGFVAAASGIETGSYYKGSTRYSKGYSSFQTFSVEKAYGKVPWLRTGGMDNLLMRLSVMKGFTKDYWGIRGSLAALFRMVKPVKVTDLRSYFMPKSEVMKHIRTKLPFENGGLFRPSEIAYLSQRYHEAKTQIDSFLVELDNPSEEFIKKFSQRYAPVKTIVESVEREVRLISVNRSKVLFPQGQKKSIIAFKKKSLEDKIEILMEKHESLFTPESLPGISKDTTSQKVWGSTEYLSESYKIMAKNELASEVIESWYTFEMSLDSDN
jgi:hypothetical protein